MSDAEEPKEEVDVADSFESEDLKKDFRRKRMAQKQIYTNPCWADYPSVTDCGLTDDDLDEQQLFKMKEVYSMADYEQVGYLGRRQFTELLQIMQITPDDDTLEAMFTEMDENGDGQIGFDEFVAAMVHNLGIEALDAVDKIELGSCGTKMWTRGEIIWGANTSLIIVAGILAVAGLIYFQFIIVPLVTSYFFVFLATPILDLFEHRPMQCGSKDCCDPYEQDPDGEEGDKRYASEPRRAADGTIKATLMDCVTLGVLPHGVSMLIIIIGSFGFFALLAVVMKAEVDGITEDPDFMAQIDNKIEEIYSFLNDSGIFVIRDCEGPRLLRYDCPEGYTVGELAAIGDTINAAFGAFGLVFLLTVYIMAEKTGKDMFEGGSPILGEIEFQVKYYIVLKTGISFLTGVLVGIILLSLQVKLAMLFGLLSFLLNFIPNVGSMIAMVLPMPIVIVDPGLATWQKLLAFIGPGIVQGYVGNVLEPVLFGASLNMTPLSILAALVIWMSLWGIMGGILSVPLLSIQKICLSHCNHPLAKIGVMMIKADPTIDEAEQIESGSKDDGGGEETTMNPTTADAQE